eukprot:9475415-Pyramimonas_sp.AAC.2
MVCRFVRSCPRLRDSLNGTVLLNKDPVAMEFLGKESEMALAVGVLNRGVRKFERATPSHSVDDLI